MLVMRRMPAERRLSRLLGGPDAGELLRDVAKAVAAVHAAAPRPAGGGGGRSQRRRRTQLAGQRGGDAAPRRRRCSTRPPSSGSASASAATSPGAAPCSRPGSAPATPSTATATCWPRTSSASTTGPASSTASPSTTGCATATCWRTSPSWPWTSSGWPERRRRATCSAGTASSPPSTTRRRWPTTTSPTGPRSGPRSPACGPGRATSRPGPSPAITCSSARTTSTRGGCASCWSAARPAPASRRWRRRWPRRRAGRVLRSDEVRKELAGLGPLDDTTAPAGHRPLPAGGGRRHLRGARAGGRALLLERGESVILDASWADVGQRARRPPAGRHGGRRPRGAAGRGAAVGGGGTHRGTPGGRRRPLRRHRRGRRRARRARFGPWPEATTVDTTARSRRRCATRSPPREPVAVRDAVAVSGAASAVAS